MLGQQRAPTTYRLVRQGTACLDLRPLVTQAADRRVLVRMKTGRDPCQQRDLEGKAGRQAGQLTAKTPDLVYT